MVWSYLYTLVPQKKQQQRGTLLLENPTTQPPDISATQALSPHVLEHILEGEQGERSNESQKYKQPAGDPVFACRVWCLSLVAFVFIFIRPEALGGEQHSVRRGVSTTKQTHTHEPSLTSVPKCTHGRVWVRCSVFARQKGSGNQEDTVKDILHVWLAGTGQGASK